VKPGEKVLTSGGDQIFPKGLPLGSVAKVSTGSQFLQVTLQPAAALNHLEEVLVITQRQEREPSVAAGEPAARAADILAQRLPSVPDKPETAVPIAAPTGQAPAKAPAGQTGSVPASKPPAVAIQNPKQEKPPVPKPAVTPVSKPAPDATPDQTRSAPPGDTPQ
jgi:rod shape-determining protein MreC